MPDVKCVTTCPYCHATHERSTGSFGGNGEPAPGCLAFCAECGKIAEFDATCALVPIEAAKLDALLAASPNMKRMMDGLAQMRAAGQRHPRLYATSFTTALIVTVDKAVGKFPFHEFRVAILVTVLSSMIKKLVEHAPADRLQLLVEQIMEAIDAGSAARPDGLRTSTSVIPPEADPPVTKH